MLRVLPPRAPPGRGGGLRGGRRGQPGPSVHPRARRFCPHGVCGLRSTSSFSVAGGGGERSSCYLFLIAVLCLGSQPLPVSNNSLMW